MFEHKLDDYSNENSREFILSCVFGTPANSGDNGRYGNRLNAFLSTKYVNAAWGIPKYTWEYGGKDDVMAVTNDLVWICLQTNLRIPAIKIFYLRIYNGSQRKR